MVAIRFSKTTKIAAALAGVMLLFSMLFSSFFIAVEAHHDCCGDDCPICATIQQCENTLHQISDGLIALTVAIFPILIMAIATASFVCDLPENTLVSQKVRLDN